ncbi:hypothetical protein GOB57_21525 [Sinorhizobium meliloti]|nr:hypothetical protein [Sinorhizobium meliloti]
MSQTPFPSKSPRARRAVAGILESIPFSEKLEVEKAVALVLEQLVQAKHAELVFKKLFAEGLRTKDPVILISAVQAYRDEVSKILVGNDEHLAKTLELKSTVITERIVNRLTDGEFRAQSDGNMFYESEMRRALAARLREVAASATAAYDAANEVGKESGGFVEGTSDQAAKTPGPKF